MKVGESLFCEFVNGGLRRNRSSCAGFGQPCIRGMRVTVGMIIGLLASKRLREEILRAYPYLEDEDIDAALKYAAWRLEEQEVAVSAS